MRKETKNQLMVLFIIFVFSMSSLAYVMTSFGAQKEEKPKTISGYVVDGAVDSQVEYEYFQKGYTILRFYYSDNSLLDYVSTLPNSLTTNTDQVQLIVEKIPADSTYAEIINLYNYKNLTNVDYNNLYMELCSNVLSPPVECILMNQTF